MTSKGISLSAQQTRLLRMKNQRIAPSVANQAFTPEQVLADVVAVQAQDLPAARLSIWARSMGLTAVKVEQARQENRSIVWTWCMRGTQHLVASQDAAWLIPFLSPQLINASLKRFRELGWDDRRANVGLNLLHRNLTERGGMTRPEIINLLKENCLPHEGQAPFHLIRRAALEGILCLGADRQAEPTYVAYETWLGSFNTRDTQDAMADIALRYLDAYGPATPEDLATWSGLKQSQAREAWLMIDERLVSVEAAGKPCSMLKDHLALLDDPSFTTAPSQVQLLPAFDTYLLGYTNRVLIVAEEHARRIHPGGGLIYPVLLINGRACGTWRIKSRRDHLEIVITPFESLASELHALVEVQVADLGRFLSKEARMQIALP